MTATLQRSLLADPLRNDLDEHEIRFVEARIEQDSEHLADHAQQATSCRCGSRSWGEPHEARCWRCGHDREEKPSLLAVYGDATRTNREGDR